MEKRAFERLDLNIQVDLYYDNGIYESTVRNLSVNSLYIDTDTCPPCESSIMVMLTLGDDFFTLRGTVKRTVNTNELSGVGVELLNPSQSYSKFVSSLLKQKQLQSNKERVHTD